MRRALPALLTALGVVLAGVGVSVFRATNAGGGTAVFGGSYAPLEPEGAYQGRLTLAFDDRWTVLWTGGHLTGALLAVVGLLLLASVAGWWLGRRSSRRGSAPVA